MLKRIDFFMNIWNKKMKMVQFLLDSGLAVSNVPLGPYPNL